MTSIFCFVFFATEKNEEGRQERRHGASENQMFVNCASRPRVHCRNNVKKVKENILIDHSSEGVPLKGNENIKISLTHSCYLRIVLNHMKLLFTVLLVAVSASVLSSQFMEIESRRSILLGGEQKNYFELEPIFKAVPSSYKYYTGSVSDFRTGRVFGYSSLAALGLGGVLLAARGDGCRRTCDAQTVGGVSILFVFPTLGTVGILFNVSGKKRQKRAVGFYNAQRPLGYEDSKWRPQLSVGAGENGITLALRF